MNLERVERIAEAVLYEGYMLYPYRASAIKNQQRWNFGVLSPQSWAEQQIGSDAWKMQTECLLEADGSTRLNIEVRFLQIVERSVREVLDSNCKAAPALTEAEFERVEQVAVDGKTYSSWQEVVERKVTIPTLLLAAFSLHRQSCFEFPAGRESEPIIARDGAMAAQIVREWKTIAGAVDVSLKECRQGLFKVTVSVRNLTEPTSPVESRIDAQVHSFISTHTILGAEGGRFISLLEPPRGLKAPVAECVNVGTWPVLAGEEGARDAMLSSPIILYDYPQIAPESPGSLFDGTEIDEILSLRILTMTDAEKQEMRQSDDRTRAILERTENMPPEQFMKLHGVLRGLRPVAEETR